MTSVRNPTILFFLDARGVSGAEIVVLRLLRKLDRTRFSPLVFCDSANTPLIAAAKKMAVTCWISSAFSSIKAVETTGIHCDKLISRLSLVSKITRDLNRCIRENDVDLIHANMYPASLYCSIAAFLTNTPLVWHDHTIRPIRWYNRFNYKVAGRLCTKIITVSEACKGNLLGAGIAPSKVTTIYNGMDLCEFDARGTDLEIRKEYRMTDDMPLVALFGQPLPEKGHRYFIEAAAEVIKEVPECRFLIVGYLFPSDYQSYLHTLVMHLGLSGHVIFTGWREDIPSVMACIDVLAHTRVTPEPAALVLMEAMAMAKPIVASNTGGTPELVVDGVTGILVPPGDSKTLARGILELLKHPVRARTMGLNGRRRVEQNFTLDNQAKAIEKLMEGILQKRAPRVARRSHWDRS